jgi:hypothetical protein
MQARQINRLSGVIVLLLSLTALLAVLGGYTQPPQPDEGTLAHVFQLSIVALLPVILLFVADHMPWAGLVVILARDLFLMAGYKLIAPQGYELKVNAIGKAATWLLYLGIGLLLVTHRATHWPYWVFLTGLGLSLLAATAYTAGAWRQVRR